MTCPQSKGVETAFQFLAWVDVCGISTVQENERHGILLQGEMDHFMVLGTKPRPPVWELLTGKRPPWAKQDHRKQGVRDQPFLSSRMGGKPSPHAAQGTLPSASWPGSPHTPGDRGWALGEVRHCSPLCLSCCNMTTSAHGFPVTWEGP